MCCAAKDLKILSNWSLLKTSSDSSFKFIIYE